MYFWGYKIFFRFGKNCCDNMTAILIWFDHGDRSETGSSVVSSVISRWAQGLEMSTDDIYGVQIVEGLRWGLGRSQLLTLQWWCSRSNMCKLEKKVINVSATCLIFIASSHHVVMWWWAAHHVRTGCSCFEGFPTYYNVVGVIQLYSYTVSS